MSRHCWIFCFNPATPGWSHSSQRNCVFFISHPACQNDKYLATAKVFSIPHPFIKICFYELIPPPISFIPHLAKPMFIYVPKLAWDFSRLQGIDTIKFSSIQDPGARFSKVRNVFEPGSRSTILKLMLTGLFYSRVLIMNRSSYYTRRFRHMHSSVSRCKFHLSKPAYTNFKVNLTQATYTFQYFSFTFH